MIEPQKNPMPIPDTTTLVDAIDNQQYVWIKNVIAGKGFVEALPKGPGRPPSLRHEESRALRYLSDVKVRRRLVGGLILAGQIDRAKEILTMASVQALEDAIGYTRGEARTKIATSILGATKGTGKAIAKPPAAPQATPVPIPQGPKRHKLPILRAEAEEVEEVEEDADIKPDDLDIG